MFHAYQEQYLGGLLSDIQQSSDHKGGSNIEAEEKDMGYLSSFYSFYYVQTDTTLLYNWCENFYNNHKNQHTDVTLTQDEQKAWFAAVEEFRQNNADAKTSNEKDLYDAPTDYDLLPTSLLNLWRNVDQDCVGQEIIIGEKIISDKIPIIKIKW